MNSVEKVKNEGREKILVLAPGAADISEGAVYLEAGKPLAGKQVTGASRSGEKPASGFCSIALGCGDVSEGMVWVAALQKSKPEVRTVIDHEEIAMAKSCAMI